MYILDGPQLGLSTLYVIYLNPYLEAQCVVLLISCIPTNVSSPFFLGNSLVSLTFHLFSLHGLIEYFHLDMMKLRRFLGK